MTPTISDRLILDCAKNNKSKAFKLAFDKYWEELYRRAHYKVRDEELAKDIVQEVFIVLWGNFDKITHYEVLLPYLQLTLRNKIFKYFEKDEVQLRYFVNKTNEGEITEPSVLDLLLDKELASVIDDEINNMPLRMKEIYTVRRENFLSIKEIALKLQLSEQTIKNQLHIALNRLRERLAKY